MSKIKFEIKNRWTGSILFEYEKENNTLKDTVTEAIKQGADLEGADLRGADLEGADLRGAYIYVSDDEINITDIVKDFEQKSNMKITDTYINKNVIPTRWDCFWRYGLIICDYKTVEKIEEMTLSQVCKELGRNIKIIKED